MTHDEELIERAVKAMFDATPAELRGSHTLEEALRYAPARTTVYAQAAGVITAVRAYDAERRASVLDVDALKSFDPKSPGTLVWLPDGMPSIPAHDPDDYRDLPVAMTGHVRFEGGLTTEKRK